jgi:hypothetical protein
MFAGFNQRRDEVKVLSVFSQLVGDLHPPVLSGLSTRIILRSRFSEV